MLRRCSRVRWLWILVVFACTRPDPVTARLRSLAVADDDFYRRVVYTWAPAESIAELRSTRRLLVATAGSGEFVSPFNQALASAADEGDQIAKVLMTRSTLIRRRYAWPAPFATVMGLGKRTYGTALIRIELRPEAWIGRFDRTGWSFVDAAGSRIAERDVLATPERIGAVFHVRTDAPDPFREYVVTNETMIATWSVGTPEIRREVDAEIALLRALRDRMAGVPVAETELPAAPQWARIDPSQLWPSTLAFDTTRYRARTRQLDAILAALAAYDPTGPPLIVRP